MNLNRMMLACALALGGLAAGCGDKCSSSCDDIKKCADSFISSSADCDKVCDSMDKIADKASCDKQKDDLLDCEDGLKDKCSAFTSCQSQGQAWSDCEGAYCTAHPGDSDCATYSSATQIDLGS